MKKNTLIMFLLLGVLVFSSCKKCYYCQNSCSVCQSSHFTIWVQSDNYGTAYYRLYLDSLTALGYTCHDTTSNKGMQVCAQSNSTLNSDVNLAQQQGYTCVPVQN